jgi:hypothetical protein
MLERSLPVAGIHAVFTKEFITECLGQEHFVLLAEVDSALCPHIAILKPPEVLMRTGHKCQHARHRSSRKRRDLSFDRGCREGDRSFQKFDCLMVLAGKVMEPALNREGVCRLNRIG